MSFPQSLDQFETVVPNTPVKSIMVNKYQKGIVSCETELTGIVNRLSQPTKVMAGFCWKIQISITTEDDPNGYGFYRGEASNVYNSSEWPIRGIAHNNDILYRYRKIREPWVVDNREWGTLGSYMPPYSFATLPLPSSGIVFPNSAPFHANNKHFVTVESSFSQTTNHNIFKGRNPWSMAYNNGQRNIGGFFSREGLLYYNGQNDLNPQYVLGDWCPSIEDWNNNKDRKGELMTVLVHMVITN